MHVSRFNLRALRHEGTLVDADVEVINQHGVNALLSFATVGPVVWGARTGASRGGQASEWKYVNVRRLAHFVEESLERLLAPSLHGG